MESVDAMLAGAWLVQVVWCFTCCGIDVSATCMSSASRDYETGVYAKWGGRGMLLMLVAGEVTAQLV